MIERMAILGGSSVYIPEFLLSVFSHNLIIKEIALLGREGPKLKLVADFCQRLADRIGIPTRIIPTTSVAEAVSGAEYILNHVRVGGMKARLRDEKLPVKHGMIGDETVGAGSIACALRTLPVILRMTEEIERVNPDARFINLTNPVGLVIEALIKCSRLNAIGVSDLPMKYVNRLGYLYHFDPAHVTIDYIGLNHMGWIQDLRMNDESLLPQILERMEMEPPEEFDTGLIRLFRMIPTRNVSPYFHRDEILKKQKSTARYRAEELYEAEKQILKLYKDPKLAEVPAATRQRNAMWYEETVVPLMAAFESSANRNIIVCMRNGGAIRDLPDDCSVELPVKVAKMGVEQRKVGNCPRFLRGLFLTLKESDRLIVEAARHKSYEFALQALTIHPLVPSLDAARRFLDAVMREDQLELH